MRHRRPGQPFNRLPEYLEEQLALAVEGIAGIEFKSTRDMQIFRDWLVFQLEEAQREQSERLMRADRERHQRRRDQRKSLDHIAQEWVKKNQETLPGTVLKVTGARDGLGYREVIEVKARTLVCYQLDMNGERKQIVEIMWNKVRGVIEFGEMEEGTRRGRLRGPRRKVTVTPLKDLVK